MGASPPAGLSLVVIEKPRPCWPLVRCTFSLRPILRVLLCRITVCVREESDAGGTFLVDMTLATLAPPTTATVKDKKINSVPTVSFH